MNERPIANLDEGALVSWISLFVIILGLCLYRDLTGVGIANTQFYRAYGNFAYPLFYGAVGFTIFKFVSMFRHRQGYVSIVGGAIRVGTQIVPFDEVLTVTTRRNWIGVRQLVIRRASGAPLRLAAYALTRPINECATDLNLALTQTPRSPDQR